MSNEDKKTWNSLEVAKLIISAFVPILIAYYGYQITERQKKESIAQETQARIMRQQWEKEHSQTEYARARQAAQADQLIKERVRLWCRIAEPLNEIYSYFMYVGSWKELNASDIIERKRECDKVIYAYRPFYSDEFFADYQQFMKAAFKTNRGWGQDAGLWTLAEHRIHEKDTSLFMGHDNGETGRIRGLPWTLDNRRKV